MVLGGSLRRCFLPQVTLQFHRSRPPPLAPRGLWITRQLINVNPASERGLNQIYCSSSLTAAAGDAAANHSHNHGHRSRCHASRDCYPRQLRPHQSYPGLTWRELTQTHSGGPSLCGAIGW